MKFIEFKSLFKDFTLFSTSDIRTIIPDFDDRRLYEWQKKHYIQKIVKGYYRFSDANISEYELFTISNKIYVPSYISLEMGLSYYHLIPESVYGITAVSSNKTKSYNTRIGTFTYRKIKSELFFGIRLVHVNNQNYLIGEMEKVILDFLYLNPNIKTKDQIDALRINHETLSNDLNMDRLMSYSQIYNNLALQNRVKLITNLLTYDYF